MSPQVAMEIAILRVLSYHRHTWAASSYAILRIVEPEDIVEEVKAALVRWNDVEELAEREKMLLAWQLQMAAHEHQHAACRTRELAVDSGDDVLALLESKALEFLADGLHSVDLLPLEREHRILLVQSDHRLPVCVELRVVVLHELLA